MLNTIYDSVSIEPKKEFNVENLKEVVQEYNSAYNDNVEVSVDECTIEFGKPKDSFALVNLIETRLMKSRGYKSIDGVLSMPYHQFPKHIN